MALFQHRKPSHKLFPLHNNRTLYHTINSIKVSYDIVCGVKITYFSTDSLLLLGNQHSEPKHAIDVRMWHLHYLLVHQT